MIKDNKFWQHSTFNLETGEELSYVDSSGKRYAFNDEGQLLYYNDLSQSVLDQLPTKSDDPHDQLFLELFSNLTLKTDFNKYSNHIFFFKGNDCMVEYDTKNECFWIDYSKILSFFETKFGWGYQQIQVFMKSRLEEYLNLPNTTPARNIL